jgi:hypothetical protein
MWRPNEPAEEEISNVPGMGPQANELPLTPPRLARRAC